jgi:hypothetical protein
MAQERKWQTSECASVATAASIDTGLNMMEDGREEESYSTGDRRDDKGVNLEKVGFDSTGKLLTKNEAFQPTLIDDTTLIDSTDFSDYRNRESSELTGNNRNESLYVESSAASVRSIIWTARTASCGESAGGREAADEWMSVSGKGLASNYTPKSFSSENVKEVYLEEWLNATRLYMHAGPARRLGEGGQAGGEVVVVIDSIIEHERRSPWVPWGEFPLFPVGDPPPLSAVCSRVAASYAVKDEEEEEELCSSTQSLTERPSFSFATPLTHAYPHPSSHDAKDGAFTCVAKAEAAGAHVLCWHKSTCFTDTKVQILTPEEQQTHGALARVNHRPHQTR